MHRADVSEVVNACDAGREGELIFRFVYEVAGCRKPMRRLWISSMEEAAIKEGFSRLKNGEEYDALFASALCRAKADWLIAPLYKMGNGRSSRSQPEQLEIQTGCHGMENTQ